MFSNLIKMLLVLSLASVVGCGLKTGEKQKEQQVAQISGVSCLKESLEHFKLFLNGESTDEQIGAATECFQKVIISFKDNVRGKDKSAYTPAELSSFIFEKVVKSETRISNELLTGVMKLKVVLVGGREDLITKIELEALSSLVARLKPELVRLNPHMKIFLGKWDYQAEEKDIKLQKFQAAKVALRTSLNRIGHLLSVSPQAYAMSDLHHLLIEVLKSKPNNAALLEKLQKAPKLLLAIKKNLIGGQDSIIGKEWVSLTSLVAEGFSESLRIKYFISQPPTRELFEDRLIVYQSVLYSVFELMPELLAAQSGTARLTNLQLLEMLAAAKEVFPDVELDPELITQAGKIKLVLIGKVNNTHEEWTQEDFKTFKSRIPDLFSFIRVTVKNFNHYKIDAEAYKNKLINYEDFAKAEAELNQAVQAFSLGILYSYDLQDMKKLALAAEPLLKDMVKYPDNLNELFELLYVAKVTLTGEPGPQLTIKNIRTLLNVGMRVYGNIVEVANFILPLDSDNKEFTDHMSAWLPKLSASIQLMLNLKDSHVITTDEFVTLFLTAQNAKILTTQIKKESLTILFNALWTSVLNKPEDRLNQKVLPGFNLAALSNVSSEIMLWLDNQISLQAIFDGQITLSKSELLQKMKTRLDETRSPITKASLGELYRLVSASGNMNFDERGYLKILTETNGQYTIRDLTKSNFGKTFMRVLIRSFAQDLQRINDYVGLNLEEAQSGFNQIKLVLVDIGILTASGAETFIASRFLEANLFLSVSNGDEYASYEELHHLFLHVMSGQARAKTLNDAAMASCLKVRNAVIINQSELDEVCLLNLYYQINQPFELLPGFLSLKTEKQIDTLTRYTPEENKDYYANLLKAAGHVANENKSVKLGDSALFPHVVQYIEMIFSTHDKNSDGRLDQQEAMQAFPVFEKLLIKLTDSKRFFIKIPDLPGLFIYLLKYGNVPLTEPAKMREFLKFIKDYKCDKPDVPCKLGWDIKSSRFDIGRIFDYIAQASKPKPPEAPPAQDPPATTPAPPTEPTQPNPPPTPAPETPVPPPITPVEPVGP